MRGESAARLRIAGAGQGSGLPESRRLAGGVYQCPVGAIDKLLARVGWSVEEVDLFEVNEAFAMVSMLAMAGCGIPITS